MRRGAILVAVLVLVAMAGMVAAGLLFRIRATVAASTAVGNGEQAYAAAISGIRRAMSVLTTEGADAATWTDNPELFRNQFVCDDGASGWYFTIYAPPAETDDEQQRYGLIDEGGKISISTAPADVLAALPGMTDELVDCLLDYRDADGDTRPNGAEQDYYDTLAYPYVIRNGPLMTLEELLLVKGFNGAVVYGEDANFSGLLEPNEDDGDETFPQDDRDGTLNAGLRGFATAATIEPDVDAEGEARININNSPRASALQSAGLSQEAAVFIELCAADGHTFSDPTELLGMTYTLQAAQKINNVDYAAGSTHTSPLTLDELPIVCDKLTTSPLGGMRVGRVNVLSASAEVLATLPGIDEFTARAIVDDRTQLIEDEGGNIAWLRTRGPLNDVDFKAAAPLLTARSCQYRVQCVGFGVPCGRIRVLEAVLDISRGESRITYLRDITRLGAAVSLDVESQEIAW